MSCAMSPASTLPLFRFRSGFKTWKVLPASSQEQLSKYSELLNCWILACCFRKKDKKDQKDVGKIVAIVVEKQWLYLIMIKRGPSKGLILFLWPWTPSAEQPFQVVLKCSCWLASFSEIHVYNDPSESTHTFWTFGIHSTSPVREASSQCPGCYGCARRWYWLAQCETWPIQIWLIDLSKKQKQCIPGCDSSFGCFGPVPQKCQGSQLRRNPKQPGIEFYPGIPLFRSLMPLDIIWDHSHAMIKALYH